LGSIGIHVEQSGGRKLILRQLSNGLEVKKILFRRNFTSALIVGKQMLAMASLP
jgi:hypothetical protein